MVVKCNSKERKGKKIKKKKEKGGIQILNVEKVNSLYSHFK